MSAPPLALDNNVANAPRMSEESVDPFGHPRIPYRGYYDRRHCDDRRAWAEKFAGSSLEQCGQWWLREGTNDSYSCTKLKGNLENVIGLAKVPLGVCGPLLFNGEDIKGYYLCPFATTEGALVASVTRGATALTRSGGVYAKVLESTQIRSPYFRLRSMHEVDLLTTWIASNSESIKNRVSFSPPGKLVQLASQASIPLGQSNVGFTEHNQLQLRAAVLISCTCLQFCSQNDMQLCGNRLVWRC